ncbi:MAG: galactose mutarotase [Acidimicrobiia bacterium]|nr:galactose mutarotase [Acidimicrobiia bacterium]
MGFDDLEGWRTDPQYFGALVGRFANRIDGGRFVLDGEEVRVGINRPPHHLHGGVSGFDKAIWSAEPFEEEDTAGVLLRHHSPDGDEGYPGALDVSVTYTLDATGALTLTYVATCDAPTIVNLTNHVYFDLGGTGSVLDHELTVHAPHFLEVDAATIPTGQILSVDRTPFDFRSPRRVGERIADDHPQLGVADGYDHCFVVDGEPGTLRPCAVVEAAGRRLEVETTQPGVQVYSGNGIRERSARGGRRLGTHGGLCLETEGFPDAPNHPHFPSARLDPGEEYREVTVYRLGPA